MKICFLLGGGGQSTPALFISVITAAGADPGPPALVGAGGPTGGGGVDTDDGARALEEHRVGHLLPALADRPALRLWPLDSRPLTWRHRHDDDRVVMTRIRQDWEKMRVGETFGPYRYAVRPEVVESLRSALGDEELTEVDGEAVAPAMLLTFPFLQLIEAKYEPPPGVIHAGQEFDLCAPVRVGAVLTCTGTITDMSRRRNRRYYSVASEAVDERGVLVARSRTTAVYPEVDLRSP